MEKPRHLLRHIPGMGYQVLRHAPGAKQPVLLGTYDSRDEAEKRHAQETERMDKEYEQGHWGG